MSKELLLGGIEVIDLAPTTRSPCAPAFSPAIGSPSSGAGFIGSEIASAAWSIDLEVTLLGAGATGASLLAGLHAEAGATCGAASRSRA